MNLVFHISENGSKIELKHCMSLKTSVKCQINMNLEILSFWQTSNSNPCVNLS